MSGQILNAIGIATVFLLGRKTLELVTIHLRPSRLSKFAHKSKRTGEDPWALVTGASDGIGLALCGELAASGFNVILHGRNPAKLDRVLSQLQSRFPRRAFRTLVVDAGLVGCAACNHRAGHDSDDDDDDDAQHHDHNEPIDFNSIHQQLSSLHLTVLINNAGGGIGRYEPVDILTETETMTNTSLNALFPLYLIRSLLPLLKQNGPSLILNISSMSDIGFPLIATYSASKAFLMSLTVAMRLEGVMAATTSGPDNSSNNNVEILGIRSGKVTGTTATDEDPSIFVPDTKTMAKAILGKAGHDHGVVVGYWGHAIQGVMISILELLPRSVRDGVMIGAISKQKEEDGERQRKRL